MARSATTTDAFSAIAEPSRRDLLDAIGVGEVTVNELVDRLGLTQPQVSKHLAVLRAVGVVLVDAVVPDVMESRQGARAVRAYGRAMRWVGVGARFGLMRPVAAMTGNMIGLEGEAAVEKRRIYGLGSHARWAAEEVSQWPATSDQAAIGNYPPDLPIAVVTAGVEERTPWLKSLQVAPALASRHGYVDHVAGAGHASLLGRRFADPIVRGVEHILAVI